MEQESESQKLSHKLCEEQSEYRLIAIQGLNQELARLQEVVKNNAAQIQTLSQNVQQVTAERDGLSHDIQALQQSLLTLQDTNREGVVQQQRLREEQGAECERLNAEIAQLTQV